MLLPVEQWKPVVQRLEQSVQSSPGMTRLELLQEMNQAGISSVELVVDIYGEGSDWRLQEVVFVASNNDYYHPQLAEFPGLREVLCAPLDEYVPEEEQHVDGRLIWDAQNERVFLEGYFSDSEDYELEWSL